MRNFSNELYRAFLDRANMLGYNAVEYETVKQPVEFFKGQEYICSLMPNGEIHYRENATVSEDVSRLSELFASMRHVYDLYDKAENLPFKGVENYKVLCEYEKFLLVAMMDDNDQLRFVTWRYSYNRDSVAYGHYFDTDYDGARQDFAIRSGLIDEQKLFKPDDLIVIYDACVYRALNDENMIYNEEGKLRKLIERIEKIVTELHERTEPEQETEQDLDQEV